MPFELAYDLPTTNIPIRYRHADPAKSPEMTATLFDTREGPSLAVSIADTVVLAASVRSGCWVRDEALGAALAQLPGKLGSSRPSLLRALISSRNIFNECGLTSSDKQGHPRP